MKERPLIAFTILAQMAVGALLALAVMIYFGKNLGGSSNFYYLNVNRYLPFIGSAMLLALFASLFHLGTPRNAYRAIANFRSSWLSREILLSGLFTAGVFGLIIRFYGHIIIIPAFLERIAFYFTALLGLGLVFIMARIYMITTQPAWNNLWTPVSFLLTSLLLGWLFLGAVDVIGHLILGWQSNPIDQGLNTPMQWLVYTSTFFLIPTAIITILNLKSPVQLPMTAFPSSQTRRYWLTGLRLALLAFCGIFLALFLVSLNGFDIQAGGLYLLARSIYVLAAFACGLFSEIIGRYLFYER